MKFRKYKSLIMLAVLLLVCCSSKEMDKAEQYMEAAMYYEAIDLLKLELQNDPKNSRAYFLLGSAYLKTQNYYLAKDNLDKASLLDTDINRSIVEMGLYEELSPSQNVPIIVKNAIEYTLKVWCNYGQIAFSRCDLILDLNDDGIKEFIYWVVGCPESRGRGVMFIYNGKSPYDRIFFSYDSYDITSVIEPYPITLLKEIKSDYHSILIGKKQKVKLEYDSSKKEYVQKYL